MSYNSSQYRRAPEATLNACDQVAVVKNFLDTDDFTTFQGKIVAEAAMTAADVTITEITVDTGDGLGDRIDINGKSAPRSGEADDATDDLLIAYYNSTASRVEYVLDATDIDIDLTNPTVNIPATRHFLRRPSLKV